MGCTASVYDPELDQQELYVQDNLKIKKQKMPNRYSTKQLKQQLRKEYHSKLSLSR